MSDLIDRQQAINVIERMRAYIGHNMERAVGAAFIEILDDVGEDIGRLPSIQFATDTNVGNKLGTNCISRQTVLNAIDEISREVDDGYGFDYAKWREYFCELPPAQLATDTNVGTKLGTDSISRQAAIDALNALHYNDREDWCFVLDTVEFLPPVQPEQTDCEYCHEDSDGYVMPLEKSCHAFIRYGMNGWELSLKAKGWHGSAKIKYCPICGRSLTHE